MSVYTREGKHAIRVGDTARVAAATFRFLGSGKIRDRGWSGAKVLRFLAPDGAPLEGVIPQDALAEVTVPARAATRTVKADRLTRTKQRSET